MNTYYWDFFGPRALGTASHFREHLQAFLNQNQVSGCETGLVSQGVGHHAVFCHTPEKAARVIELALKPQRRLDAIATDPPNSGAEAGARPSRR